MEPTSQTVKPDQSIRPDYLIRGLQHSQSISLKILEQKPIEILLTDIMNSSKEVMNAEASSLLLYDAKTERLDFIVAHGEQGGKIKKMHVKMGQGIAGWVAKNRQSVLIKDCYKDERFDPSYDKRTSFTTKSVICVPLLRNNELLGVMQVINKKDHLTFHNDDLTIFLSFASQCSVAIENAKLVEIQIASKSLEFELETAREIQQKLLPKELPEYKDLDISAKLVSATQVGGDYYDVIKINDYQSLFMVADVSGKGIPAALIVSTVHACLRTQLLFSHIDVVSLAEHLNNLLLQSTTLDKFVTVWLGLYDHPSKTLHSVNAGHFPPLILRKGSTEMIQLDKGGPLMGMFDLTYRFGTTHMEKDDLLILYTDGITEAHNDQNEMFGTDGICEIICKNDDRPAVDILKAIENGVNIFTNNAPFEDDFTCVVVKVQ